MHMADALLSPAVGMGFYAVSGGILALSCRKIAKEEDYEKKIPLMGVMGAFVFAAQMINFAIPGTGSSGHIGGGLLLAALLGPYAAFIVISAILTVQCLFFADGGLIALGCNIFNLGFWPALIGFPIFKIISGKSTNMKRIMIASIIAVVVSLEAGAFSVACETVLSGRTELPFVKFSVILLLIHLPIAVAEGIMTAFVYSYVRRMIPEKVERPVSESFWEKDFGRRIAVLAMAVVLIGGVLSWFASSFPDGLEWSIGKLTGSEEVVGKQEGIFSFFKSVQEKTAFLPDYAFSSDGEALETDNVQSSWPNVRAETSVAGLSGGLITALIIVAIAFLLGFVSKISKPRPTSEIGFKRDLN